MQRLCGHRPRDQAALRRVGALRSPSPARGLAAHPLLFPGLYTLALTAPLAQVDTCAEHLRICAENNKECDTRVCDQIRGAVERLRLDNSPENRAQVAAELAEAMNMAELSELARDPDIQALLQEG